MAGRMISELNNASTLNSTDLIPLARGSSTLKLGGAALTAVMETIATNLVSAPMQNITMQEGGKITSSVLSATEQVNVNVDSTSPGLKITQSGSGPALYVEDMSGDTNPFVVDSAGHVGVGTDSPNESLTVVGNISASGNVYGTITGNVNGSVTGSIAATSPSVISVNSSSDALRVTQTGAGNALVVEDYVNPDSTPFVVTSNGSVGVGTATPNQKLTVIGNVSATGNVSTIGDLNAGGNASVTGNVGVGTASPNEKLTVVGNVSATGNVSASGNVSATGNVSASGNVSATGNVTIGDSLYMQELSASYDSTSPGLAIRKSGWNILNVDSLSAAGYEYDAAIKLRNYSADGLTNLGYWTITNDRSEQNELGIRYNNNTKMVITSAGYVGIGTVAPKTTLDVTGDVWINGLTIGNGKYNRDSNTCIGYNALSSTNTDNSYNTAIGYTTLAKLSGRTITPTVTAWGKYNTAVGARALEQTTTGAYNTSIGVGSMVNNLTGSSNVAIGVYALADNTYGDYNVAIGNYALTKNVDGYNNFAIGQGSLATNTIGYNNIAVGRDALYNNVTATDNFAIGNSTLQYNTIGYWNMALGTNALRHNDIGHRNIAIGVNALQTSTEGINNIAIGTNAADALSGGYSNIAIGVYALTDLVQDGNHNLAVGLYSLSATQNSDENVCIGDYTMRRTLSGSRNVAIGYAAGDAIIYGNDNILIGWDVDATNSAVNNNQIVIGSNASSVGDNTIVIGNSSHVTTVLKGNVGLGGTISPSFLLQLATDSAAKPSTSAWTTTSDERVKENIRPFTKGLDAIIAVNPVVYDYNGKAGFNKTKDNIGVIAQEIVKVVPEGVSTYFAKLVEDDAESVELMNFNSHPLTYIMINAIKELNAKVDAQAAEIAALKAK